MVLSTGPYTIPKNGCRLFPKICVAPTAAMNAHRKPRSVAMCRWCDALGPRGMLGVVRSTGRVVSAVEKDRLGVAQSRQTCATVTRSTRDRLNPLPSPIP